MRQFFAIDQEPDENGNLMINSRIEEARVHNSLIVSVNARSLTLKNCLLIHSVFRDIEANGCLFYNYLSKESESVSNECRVNVVINSDIITLRTGPERDGGEDWHEQHSGNDYSYDDIYQLNSQQSCNDVSRVFKQYYDAYSEGNKKP